jgi:hypothetical protein
MSKAAFNNVKLPLKTNLPFGHAVSAGFNLIVINKCDYCAGCQCWLAD